MKARLRAFFDFQIILPSAVVGILVALAFPPVGLWPLAWLAFVGAAYGFLKSENVRAKAPLYFFWYTVWVHLFGFYWVTYLFHEFASLPWVVAGLAFVLATGALAIPSYFWGWLYRWSERRVRVSSWATPLVMALWLAFAAVLWDFFDWRIYPWTPVMSVGGWEILLSSAGVLGTRGWQIFFFLSAVLCAFLMLRPVSKREKALNVISAAVFFWALPILAGFWNRKSLMEEYKHSQPVAILQGNIANTYKKNVKLGEVPSVRLVASIYRDLVEEATIHFYSETDLDPERPPVYFWPETSYPSEWNRQDFLGLELRDWIERSKGLHLIGAYESGVIEFGGTTKRVDFNVVAAMGPGITGEAYHKMIRMPFGEYIPGDMWFPQAYKWLPVVNHFGAGLERKFLNAGGKGPIYVPLICYEILVHSFVDDFVAEARARHPDRDLVLVNPSNDSWYGMTSQPFQNEYLSRWHAARLRLPMVRPANTGLSVVLAPWGEVLAEGHLDEPEVIYADLPLRAGP